MKAIPRIRDTPSTVSAGGINRAPDLRYMHSVQFGHAGADTRAPQPLKLCRKARPRKECLAAANGTLDDDYKRCRFGYEEYVRYDSQGHRIVLNSRALTRY